MKEILIEIELRFDLEPSYEDENSVCSPVGLQFRVLAPFQYFKSMASIYYRLRPDEEVILQPSMMFKIGSLTFLCERFNTGVSSQIGTRHRMEDAYAV